MRYLLIIVVITLMNIQWTQAQELDLDIIDLEISEGQMAHIIPLYENFDLFVQLASGDLTMRDLPREQRFIYVCGLQWITATRNFGVQSLEDRVAPAYMAEYRERATRIDQSVIETVTQALIASATLLPSEDLRVCLVPVNQPVSLIGGSANEGNMIILLGEYRAQSARQLSVLVAHEYHHHARRANPQTRSSGSILLEQIVTEGMAEVFSYLVYPEIYDRTHRLDYDLQEYDIWTVVAPQLRSLETDEFPSYMTGERNDLPPGAGYYLGYQIVSAYIEQNPGVPVAEWSFLSADQIFDASGYNPHK